MKCYSDITRIWIYLLNCIYNSELKYEGNKVIKFNNIYIGRIIRYGRCKGLIVYQEKFKLNNNPSEKKVRKILLYKKYFYDFYKNAEMHYLYDEYLNIQTSLHHYYGIIKVLKKSRKQNNSEYLSNLNAFKQAKSNEIVFLLLNSLFKKLQCEIDVDNKLQLLTAQQINGIKRLFIKEQ